ncbi:putative LOC110439812 homolog [Mastacembelus armatus]|uniref:putative LOC110439812 homolog n=1 Tax=Mastacembelus armatus TaxID=205130 RepID=UPI000E455319|nr:kinesin-like protein KIN-14I [Mastacembelus armatus]
MYGKSSGAENGSYSLNFLGKKVGRHHSVAPAGKQFAWETNNRPTCSEEPGVSSRPGLVPVAVEVLEDLPGSVPELKNEKPCPTVHNTQFDQYEDNTTGSSESQLSDNSEAERSENVKIYIPYESAEHCITQIAKDMVAMKRRHLEMVQELKENFQITARENQECTMQKIGFHYQNKLNTLRQILDLYQEKVEKKNDVWKKKVAALTAQNEQLQEEQAAERRRHEVEAQQWHREKSKMLELFSNRLDILHSHQASTLQELQMARQEVGKIQEMLMISSHEKQEAAEEGESSAKKDQQQTVPCNESGLPLEGAKARLQELKENLYQREREITELLEAERSPVPLIPQPPCSVLLPVVIHKAHAICSAVTETRAVLDQMIEENQIALVQAREKLNCLQQGTEDSNDKEAKPTDEERSDESSLSLLKETVRQYEVSQIALDSIKTGENPVTKDCDAVSELEDMLGCGTTCTTERMKSVGQQLLLLQDQLKQVKEENKNLIENYTTERTMRKKYYNMVEDTKGKIRVFCRIRTEAVQGGAIVVDKADDYSVTVETPRGPREFQFDKVFSAEASQEDLFQDTSRLIQSALDGYNVCIFAYGQTGSGKTFTMVGDKEQKHPGIIPRSFNAIFDIIQENSTKFDFKVSAYMLELYNDRLQDLLVSLASEAHGQLQSQARRVEIKRNRKGVVFAQGAETKEASSAQELYALFHQACANRHISATKMNVESSRSHLIVGIMVENRNLTNGSVSTGKLSLVDLAGSERAAKTGAKDHQLKEANSINKSLSALGDVISALSAELPHVPYRNSKLTQVMQDSLGGNAKTLMIVNVSPSECNLDETLTSLIYATRVKAITNNAQRNVDSKEIAQLKEVIMKLRSGQTVEEEDI